MKSCIELVLSGGSFFEFSRMLLENQIENIRHTGSPAQARAYLVLVEQLGSCLRELKTLEKAISMDEARSMLGKLLAAQERERKEMEEQMAEEARNLQHFQLTTKDWLTIRRNPRLSSKVRSKLLPLLRLLLLGRKP